MRTLLTTIAFVLAAAPAFAGSIEPIATGSSTGGSISAIRCDDCPALRPKAKIATYHVDALAPGTQKIEVREANGERKIFRTEAWMGGSPVLFVSKAPEEEAQKSAEAVKPAEDRAVTVDAAARTGALTTTAAHEAASATMIPSREFDPAQFELRLN
jgi:hypothetical protein